MIVICWLMQRKVKAMRCPYPCMPVLLQSQLAQDEGADDGSRPRGAHHHLAHPHGTHLLGAAELLDKDSLRMNEHGCSACLAA